MRCRLYIGIAFLLVFPGVLLAQVMESASYQIQRDSINIGGIYSTSSSYVLEDTVGEQATGRSSSTNYNLQAGYQQLDGTSLSLTPADDVSMSPSIDNVAGGTSNGSTAVTVTTNNAAGYELSLKAGSDPAMQSGSDSIADYTPSGANPDFTFSVPSSASEFGFTSEGDDVAQRFQDNGAVCNAGAADASDSCWDGLSTSDVVVARRVSANNPGGTETTLKFRISVGSEAAQPAGTYTAASTLTLVAL